MHLLQLAHADWPQWAQPKTLGWAQHTACRQGCVQLCGPSQHLCSAMREVELQVVPHMPPQQQHPSRWGAPWNASAAQAAASLRTSNNTPQRAGFPDLQ